MFKKYVSALGGKKAISTLSALALAFAFAGAAFLPAAQASVNLTAGPTSLAPNPVSLPSNSNFTPLFTFSLNNTAGENLTGVTLQVMPTSAAVSNSTTQLGAFYLYKDNGSGVFSPGTANLLGTQTAVTASSTATVTPGTFTPATGKFYIAFGSSLYWNSSLPQNSIKVTMPSNSIATSGGTLVTPAIATAALSASSTTLPSLLSAVAEYSGVSGTPGSLVLTFSQPVTKFGLSSGNIGSQFTVSNGHSLLDSLGNLGNATWSADGTQLTINFSAPTSGSTALAPTIMPGDIITLASGNGIADSLGNVSTGSATVTGSFTSPSGSGVFLNLSSPSVVAGSPVFGSASLNSTNGNASGTVTYNYYANLNCSAPPVFVSTQTVSGGTVPSSQNFSSNAVGTYSVQAVYSGDSSGNAPATSPCQTLVLSAASQGATPVTLPAPGTTSLPRTGQSAWLLLLAPLAAGLVLARKTKLI